MTLLSIWIGAIFPQGRIQFLLCSICCRCSCSRLECCLFDSSVFKQFTCLYKKAVNYLRHALQLLDSGSALLSSWMAPVFPPLCCIVFSWSVCFQQQDSLLRMFPDSVFLAPVESFSPCILCMLSCHAFCVCSGCPQLFVIFWHCVLLLICCSSLRIGFQQQEISFTRTIPRI